MIITSVSVILYNPCSVVSVVHVFMVSLTSLVPMIHPSTILWGSPGSTKYVCILRSYNLYLVKRRRDESCSFRERRGKSMVFGQRITAQP